MNKKLSKIGLIAISVSTSFVLGLGSVKAISIGAGPVNGYLGYDNSKILLTESEGTYTMKLEDNVNHDIEINSGEKVILDLNGKNLTNYSIGVAAIHVKDGGELTIKGQGKVTQKADSGKVSVVVNKGTLIIEGGSYETTIAGNHAISNEGTGTITIKNGEISTGATDVFGLANFGTATITGGIFTQKYNYSVINNLNKMTISGGTFTISEDNTAAYSLITNESVTEGKNAELTISNGSFTGNNGIFHNDGEDKIVISGGKYAAKDTTDLAKYIDENNKLNEDGEIVALGAADYTKVDAAVKKFEALKKADYTEETYKALEEAINKINRDLKENKQADVDKMASDIENAIKGLKKVEAPVKEETKKEDPKDDKDEIKVPNTADSYTTNAVFGFVSVLGIGALSLLLKKRR